MDEITRIDIRGIEEMPTLPAYFNRIMSSLQNEETSVDELAEIIQEDMALCARLLKLANSAYYGRLKKVSSIKQVIMTLGFNEVKALSLSIAVFDSCSLGASESSLQALWSHSLATATAVNQVCRKTLKEEKARAYLGGLLHDVGKLAFFVLCGGTYVRGLEGQDSDYSLIAREEMAFGVHHAQLGGWLAKRWEFPSELAEMVEFHHRPDTPGLMRSDLVSIVYLSNLIASEPDMESLVQAGDPTLIWALGKLDLDQAGLMEICQAYAEAVPETETETETETEVMLEAEC